MPRTSENDIGKRYRQMKTNIEWLQVHSGKTTLEIAQYMGISDKLYRKRKKEPESFTVDNIDRMARLFNVGSDKIIYGRVEFIGGEG